MSIVEGQIEPIQEADVIQQIQFEYANAYSEELGGNAALDPAMWGLIIDAVANLLKNCMANRGGLLGGGGGGVSTGNETHGAMYLRQAQRGGPLVRFQLRRHIQPMLTNAYGPKTWKNHNGPAIIEAVVKGSAKLNEGAANEFIQQIQLGD